VLDLLGLDHAEAVPAQLPVAHIAYGLCVAISTASRSKSTMGLLPSEQLNASPAASAPYVVHALAPR
jgi:hypothetical protein